MFFIFFKPSWNSFLKTLRKYLIFIHKKVDLVLPNKERVFDQIKDLFDKFNLLSGISLSELLSDDFIENFLLKGNMCSNKN